MKSEFKNYKILFLGTTNVLKKNTFYLDLEEDRETSEKVQDLQLMAEKIKILSNKNKFKYSNMLFLIYFSLKTPYANILIAKIILWKQTGTLTARNKQ